MHSPSVAVLFQAIDPPIINGVRKPKKPGGYQDSGADIAYVLRRNGIRVVTPESDPDPRSQEGWCFPDTEEGILAAVRQGATHLWANTILFSSHPLQTSNLQGYEDLRIVGPQPGMVDKFDDKACLNDKLRQLGFTLPRLRTVDASDDMASLLQSVEYPIVAKPVRGRGSHGVKICASPKKLRAHLVSLFQESPTVMLEEFLAGEEATLTIMPPSKNCPRYWSLPPVIRFNHVDGIAPYNGVVAVTKNSRVVPEESRQSYSAIIQEAEQVAELLQAASPIRIDIRRFQDGHAFALFDINMKPNMTGPGRPGREDQASLTALAAEGIGWDYPTLLGQMMEGARTVEVYRNYNHRLHGIYLE